MKRSLKILTVIAALALCLILTGCYEAPDDRSSSGSTTVNSYPFLTTTPPPNEVIVNTPDSQSNETQNVFGGNQTSGTVTVQTAVSPSPTPGDHDWGQFGLPTGVTITLGSETGSPTPDGTISIVTETPPASTPPATRARPPWRRSRNSANSRPAAPAPAPAEKGNEP